MKYYISKETNSVYWIDDSDFEFKTLMFANIKGDNTFDPVYDGGEVDENLIGDEYIDENHLKTFSELYSDIRKALA